MLQVGGYFAFLVAPRGHVRSRKSIAQLAQSLNGFPFVGYPGSTPQFTAQRDGLRLLGIAEVTQVLSASSTEALLSFVREGLGFSLLPWPDPRGPLDRRIDSIRLRGPGTEFPVIASYRAQSNDPLVTAALDALG